MPRPLDLKKYIYLIKNYSKCCGISTYVIIVVVLEMNSKHVWLDPRIPPHLYSALESCYRMF